MKSLYRRMPGLILCLSIVALSSCSQTLKFIPSTVVPGADGKVKVSTDNNNNYAVDITVNNLADPGLLQTPKANYVVWMETVNNGTQNLGRLATSQGLFSKAMRGSLETVTPYKPVKFFITAEDESQASYPGPQLILTSESDLVRDRN